MVTKEDYAKASFKGVAIAFILFGAAIFAVSLVFWFFSYFWSMGCSMAYPFFKALAGLMVMGVGYIILELEILRMK